MKGQGSLEYLIIIAAVLAIAAIVVLFLTGAFSSQAGSSAISQCKDSAARCKNEQVTGVNPACNYCMDSCKDVRGFDVMATTVAVNTTTCNASDTASTATACMLCRAGDPLGISAG